MNMASYKQPRVEPKQKPQKIYSVDDFNFKHQYSFSDTAYKDIITVMMTPQEFLNQSYLEVQRNRARAGMYSKTKPFENYEEYERSIFPPELPAKYQIGSYMKGLKAGKEFPIPFIQFDDTGYSSSHEGRHTAKALQGLGVALMPVTIEKPKGVYVKFQDYPRYKEQYSG
jgi:hypothetical protein